MDSIRQVDVDLNFLLLLYSTVGPCRLVCLFGRLDICWEIFLGGQNTLAAHPMLYLGGQLPTLAPRCPHLCTVEQRHLSCMRRL